MKFSGKIDTSTFYDYVQFLDDAYGSGKFDDSDYNKALVTSWLELARVHSIQF